MSFGVACQRCPFPHFHQIRFLEPDVTSLGSRPSFESTSQKGTNLGCRLASEPRLRSFVSLAASALCTETHLGHPVDSSARERTAVDQRSPQRRQRHCTFFLLLAATSVGVRPSSSHSFVRSGWVSDKLWNLHWGQEPLPSTERGLARN
jgi:hypothetical protein